MIINGGFGSGRGCALAVAYFDLRSLPFLAIVQFVCGRWRSGLKQLRLNDFENACQARVRLRLVQYVLHDWANHRNVVRVILQIVAVIQRLIVNSRLCQRKFRPGSVYSSRLHWGRDAVHAFP